MSFEPVRFVVQYKARDGKREELRELLEATASEMLFEDECIGADVLQDVREPDRFLLLELWTDPDAHDRYLDALEEVGALAPILAACGSAPDTRIYQKLT